MAATMNHRPEPTSAADLSSSELVEYRLIETLAQVSMTEDVTEQLAPELAFDVGCHLVAARKALDAALAIASAAIAAQHQPNVYQRAA